MIADFEGAGCTNVWGREATGLGAERAKAWSVNAGYAPRPLSTF